MPNNSLRGPRPQEMATEWIWKTSWVGSFSDSTQYPDAQDHSQAYLDSEYRVGNPVSRAATVFPFPWEVVHATIHMAPWVLLFGFPGFQCKDMRPHEVRVGSLPRSRPSCPTGGSISCNNSTGIAAAPGALKELAQFWESLLSVSPELRLPSGF